MSDAILTQQILCSIIEFQDDLLTKLGPGHYHTHLAGQLSRLADRAKPWTGRYVQSVAAGTLEPSDAFSLAVEAYGATLDDAPAVMTYTVQVTVLARPGALPENGALVLGEAKPCSWPGCRVIFVPRVPWQRYCSLELHLQAKREKRGR